jgi:hypothetical protein
MRGLLLFSIALVGCRGSIVVVEAREVFAASHHDATVRATAAVAEAQRRERLLQRLDDLVETRQLVPLPALRRLVSSMKAGAKSLRAQARGLQRLRPRLAKLGLGLSSFEQDSVHGRKYADLERKREALERTNEQAYQRFLEQPKSFDSLCKQHGFGPIDTSGFGDRMGAKIKEMDVVLAKASARVAAVEDLLGSEGLSESQGRQLRAAMVQLETMTERRSEVRRTALRFRLETKAGPQAVIAPGMVTFDLFARLDNFAADLRAAGRRIDELVKKLPSDL